MARRAACSIFCVLSIFLARRAAIAATAHTQLQCSIAPLQQNGALLLWARDLETSGLARFSHDPATRTLTFTRQNVCLSMRPLSHTAQINGMPVPLRTPASIIQGRAMVPGRFVLDALGLSHVSIPAAGVPSHSRQNSDAICGRVLYAGRPLSGITLRLVRADDFTFIPDLRARTGAAGRYCFGNIPPGNYRIYAYVGDNPRYFNRVTARIELSGRAAQAPAINMGRMLHAGDPPQAAIISPSPDMIFTWSPCPHAGEYHLSITDAESSEEVFSATTSAPRALVNLSHLNPGREYTWRVTATDAAGAFLGGSPGSGAEPWTFSVAID